MTDLIPFPKSTELAKISENIEKNFEQDAARGLGAHVFGKFAKGTWEIGSDARVPGDDEVFALNPFSISAGAICWKGGRPVEEIMHPVSSGERVNMAALPDHGPYERDGDGWREQSSFQAKSLDNGVEVIFKGSSGGFNKLRSKLSSEFANRLKTVGPDGALFPVISLSSDSYRHDDYGRIFTPEVDVVGWATEEQLLAGTWDPSEDEKLPPAAA